jgi:hypothetical protein
MWNPRQPSEEDYLVETQTKSGFYETGVDLVVQSLYKGEGGKTVIRGGSPTHKR